MLKVNELFAGIGAFRKALLRMGIPHEVVGISEIDKYAIKSYNAMYGDTRNYGDISKVDKLDYADLWTYGFPCQDISIAGKQCGIVKGETRSGLLYEVQRLLTQAALDDELPKYLIMENVKNLVGKKFKSDFESWCDWLDGLGYNNYWQVMSAADYGIPQARERVFCISIRKDVDTGFVFPSPRKLKEFLIDKLEPVEDIDEKYYLSEYVVESYYHKNEYNEKNGIGFRFSPIDRSEALIAKTITTKEGQREYNNYIKEYGEGKKSTIRRFTPRECWRVTGFDDTDFDKAQEVNSDTQLYKQAGNSIGVNIIEALLGNLLIEERSDWLNSLLVS